MAGENAALSLQEQQESGTEIISVAEACDFLGVHRNTIYKLIREGEIPAFRLITGGRWKFRKSFRMAKKKRYCKC